MWAYKVEKSLKTQEILQAESLKAERVNRSITYACPPFALPQVFLWLLLGIRQIQAREPLQPFICLIWRQISSKKFQESTDFYKTTGFNYL